MPKKLWKNIGGVWTPATNVWINVGGVWKDRVIPWVNIGGVWKDCMEYPIVTYSMNITTAGVCTPMGIAGGIYTLSHNVTLSGLPVGNTVNVHLRFHGGITLPNSSASVTYSVYGTIYKNTVSQPSYVTTGSFGPTMGSYSFTDTTYTLSSIGPSDTIIIDRSFSAQQNPDGTHTGWWGTSMCTLTVDNSVGVPVILIPGTTSMDLQQLCS